MKCEFCNSIAVFDKNNHCINCGAPLFEMKCIKDTLIITSKKDLSANETKRLWRMFSKQFRTEKIIVLNSDIDVRYL